MNDIARAPQFARPACRIPLLLRAHEGKPIAMVVSSWRCRHPSGVLALCDDPFCSWSSAVLPAAGLQIV